MKLRHFIESNIAGIVATTYALIFLTVFGLSLLWPENDLWGMLVFFLTCPWSVILLYVAAWSLAHDAYPLDYYFVPCAAINAICLYLLCSLNAQSRKNATISD